MKRKLKEEMNVHANQPGERTHNAVRSRVCKDTDEETYALNGVVYRNEV